MAMHPNSTCNQTTLPYEDSRQLLVAVYGIVFAVGLPANCVTAILTFMQIHRGNILAIYLFSLSLCELMYLSTIPLWIIYVQNDHEWTMGETSCKWTGYIFFCNIYISILLLCCISVDRYVAVEYALESRGIRSQRNAVLVTVFLFGMVAVIYSPVFVMKDVQDSKNRTCFEAPLNNKIAIYNLLRFLVGFIVPFMILIFMNYKIFKKVKISSSLTPHQKSKVMYLIIALILIFVVCFAPYHSVLLIRAVYFHLHPQGDCTLENKTYTISTIFLCLSTCNSIADPFIYVLATENARHKICRTFRAARVHFWNDSRTVSDKLSNTPKTLEDPSLGHKEDR